MDFLNHNIFKPCQLKKSNIYINQNPTLYKLGCLFIFIVIITQKDMRFKPFLQPSLFIPLTYHHKKIRKISSKTHYSPQNLPYSPFIDPFFSTHHLTAPILHISVAVTRNGELKLNYKAENRSNYEEKWTYSIFCSPQRHLFESLIFNLFSKPKTLPHF